MKPVAPTPPHPSDAPVNAKAQQIQSIVIQIAPAFLFRGESKQPPEPFHIGAFFDLQKDKQFETVCRLTYGKNMVNPHPADVPTFAAMKRFRNRIAADEKKNQPPTAGAEPPKQ